MLDQLAGLERQIVAYENEKKQFIVSKKPNIRAQSGIVSSLEIKW